MQQAIPEPRPDAAAPPAEPSPDSAVVNTDTAVVKEDASVQVNEDAAPTIEVPKLRGGGFCAIAPAPTPAPAGFLVLALAGLALLRRRR